MDAQSIIDGAYTRADWLVGQAQGMAGSLAALGSGSASIHNPGATAPSFSPPSSFNETVPSAPSLSALPSMPSPGTPPAPTSPSMPTAPTMPALSSIMAMPAAPSFSVPSMPTAPSLNTGLSLPTPPSMDMPAAPSLRDLDIPKPPSIDIPAFGGDFPEVPVIAVAEKTIESYWGFDSPLSRVWDAPSLDAAEAMLFNDIQTGGIGVSADVEDAIWSRGAERDLAALDDALQSAAATFGKMGFPVPPDRLRAQQADLASKYLFTRADKSRDVMVASAELAQKNRQFAITAITEIERLHLQAVTTFADRMLQVAKASVEAGIHYMNAHIAKYNAQLDAYKTQSAVFESLIRAEAQKLEIYRGELEGAKIRGELNMQQLEVYKARLAALETGVSLYKGQIEGFTARMSVEKLRVDIFKAQVEAHQAQLQGDAVKVSAYEAQVRAVAASAEIPKAQAAIGASQSQMYAAQVDAVIKQSQVNIEQVKAWATAYDAQVAAFASAAQSTNSANSNMINAYRTALEGYTAKARVAEANTSAYGEHFKALASLYAAQATAAIESGKLAVSFVQGQQALRVQAVSGATNALSTMAAGAMSAVNGIAQVIENK